MTLNALRTALSAVPGIGGGTFMGRNGLYIGLCFAAMPTADRMAHPRAMR
jgi:hypothetical protein